MERAMRDMDVVIVGGGQAGLAMSQVLSARRIAHVVLERGRVGERWRSERWDSLRMLTPRWHSRLPGYRYRGPDAEGFMTREEVVRYLEAYARSFQAPVVEGVTVTAVARDGVGFRVETDRGTWLAPNVVVATGHCEEPRLPAWAAQLPPGVEQVVPTRYRNPSHLAPSGVLVVGASATGVQLGLEIHRSGRPVTLSASRHTRVPRRYRGRDIFAWYDLAGIADDRVEAIPDVDAARRSPSLQLVGTPQHRTLDLGVLREEGVRIVGRALGVLEGRVCFGSDLDHHAADADARLARLLSRIDRYIEEAGIAAPPADPVPPLRFGPTPTSLDLAAEGIRTVVWATGYRRRFPWLRIPLLDEHGELRHDGGVTPVLGLYVIGLPFLRRRKSGWLDGVGDDARELADHLAARLRRAA